MILRLNPHDPSALVALNPPPAPSPAAAMRIAEAVNLAYVAAARAERPSMTVRGVQYVERVPSVPSCGGCAFVDDDAACLSVDPISNAAFGRSCRGGAVVYVRKDQDHV